jgi:hypothetical protein
VHKKYFSDRGCKFFGFRVPVFAAAEALDARFGNLPSEAVDSAFGG